MKLRIKELRESLNLSTYQVAERMGIPQATYSRFERGASKADLEKLELFAKVLDMSIVDVLMWPEKYVNVRDIDNEFGASDIVLKFKVKADKRDAVLAAVLSDNVELLK